MLLKETSLQIFVIHLKEERDGQLQTAWEKEFQTSAASKVEG